MLSMKRRILFAALVQTVVAIFAQPLEKGSDSGLV
jgi:hypothetical protein